MIDRELLYELYFNQGKSHKEISEELGRDISSVIWKRRMLKKSGELDWNYRG